jgi:hypothetical protein
LTCGEIRAGIKEEIETKTNISFVLRLDELDSLELYAKTKQWFISQLFENERVYRFAFNGVSGWPEPILEKKKPLVVDSIGYRIYARLIKCVECCATWSRQGKLEDMVYAMDIRFRDGRLKVTIWDFWSLESKVYLREYTTKDCRIILSKDHLIRKSLENEAARLEESLRVFLSIKRKAELPDKPKEIPADKW